MKIYGVLKGCVTDAEARAALTQVADVTSFNDDGATWGKMRGLLDGDPAGWIGVAILLVPPGHEWVVRSILHATVYRPDQIDWVLRGEAQRPDCALAIAALRARRLCRS